MGRMARERILSEHLPEHRAAFVLEKARNLEGSSPPGADAEWTALLFELSESKMLRVEPGLLEAGLFAEASGPEGAERLVHFLASRGDAAGLAGTLATALSDGAHAGHAGFDLACSMAALRLELFDLAKAFWYRRCEAVSSKWVKPEDPVHLLVLWAELLHRTGRTSRPGFPYDHETHLPRNARECLLLALNLQGRYKGFDRRIIRLLMDMEGGDHIHLGILSDLSLRNRSDWRLGVELGFLNLACFRVGAGFEELEQARLEAKRQGRERAFMILLAAKDKGGLVTRALKKRSALHV
jgi:hypothetical protein